MEKEQSELIFSVEGVFGEEELTPSNLTLPLIAEFLDQVTRFLKGTKGHNLSQVKTSIEMGSVRVKVYDQELLSEVRDEYETMKLGKLDEVDSIRASIIEQWQVLAISNNRTYGFIVGPQKALMVTSATRYKRTPDLLIDVEKYVYGRVYDIGGKDKPNIHVELKNGNTIKISSDVAHLAEDKINRLYREQLIRVKAKQNHKTGEAHDEIFVSFEDYSPEFDEGQFQVIVNEGAIAWDFIDTPTTWVESIRGNA